MLDMGDMLKLIAEQPLGMVSVVIGVFFITSTWVRLMVEHQEFRKRLGLVPLLKLTEDEKRNVLVSSAVLEDQLEKQNTNLEKKFLSKRDYSEGQQRMTESIVAIVAGQPRKLNHRKEE